jgi:CubicO group peptidase (beta-lactamase class C family)
VSPHPDRDYWPTREWRTSPPAEHGLDPETLAHLDRYARDSSPPITALLVVRHGYVVFERYYQGSAADRFFKVYSITKSVISALVGCALQRGDLRSVDQRLMDLFPEYVDADADPRRNAITLHHILSMTSGFDPRSTDIEMLWRSDDVVQAALERPLAHAPGDAFWYDDVSLHLASVILTRATGLSTASLAKAALFDQLGIVDDATRPPWTTDRHGYNAAGFGLSLTAREMAKLGYLYLNSGYWDGVQVIPRDYVRASTIRQSAGGPPVGRAYGFCWWIPEPHAAFFATGLGAQTIHITPGLDLVTAFTTASSAQEGEHRGRILEGFVLPAILGAENSRVAPA